MTIKRLTNPLDLVISLAEAKQHLRSTPPDDDDYITQLIYAAAAYCETYCRRVLAVANFACFLDSFPSTGLVVIQKSPMLAVTSIKYINSAGVETTLAPADYDTDVNSEPPRIRIANAPATADKLNAVTINFTAGYANTQNTFDATLVPQGIKRAMLLIIGHLYEHREQVLVGVPQTEIDFGVDRLLDAERLFMF